MTLYVARHGETNKNKNGLLLGQTEEELNEIGVQQAHELGNKLQDLNIDLIISSSMIRARQTAEIVDSYLEKQIIFETRLIERNIGKWEGLTFDEMSEKYQKGFTPQMAYDNTPINGESSEQVKRRVFAVLDEIKLKSTEGNILIIAHSFVSKMINKYFNPDISAEEFFNFSLKNGEVRRFVLN